MIDKSKLSIILQKYKNDSPEWCADEKFKWEVIKRVHDNWNVEAENFGTGKVVAERKI